MTLSRLRPWLTALIPGFLLTAWTVVRMRFLPPAGGLQLPPGALFAIALPYFTALARWGAYSRARYVTHSPEDDPVHPVLRRATTHGGTAIAIIISALMSAGLAGPLELTWPHLEATLYFFSLALLCFLPASYWGVWWWAQLMAGYFQLKPPA